MLVEYEELYDAYIDCRKRKRSSTNCQQFEIDSTRKLWQLWKDLNNGSYTIGRSIAFIVHHPKDREVFAADFRDRIVHHLIIRRIEKLLEEEFIEDSYSCRKGKGTLYGIERCEMYMREVSENYTKKAYILKGDFKSFFMRINKPKMYQAICDLLDKRGNFDEESKTFMKHVIWLIVFNRPQDNCIRKQPKSAWKCLPKDKSLFSCEADYGVPIGNLTSQIFANLFMSAFDHWIKDTLGIKEYGRYVDDFYIVMLYSQVLVALIPQIRKFLSDYGVTLHPHKVSIQEVEKGIQFLGQVIKPYGRLVARKTIGTLYTKLQTFDDFIEWHKVHGERLSEEDIEYIVSSVNSYYGYFRQSKSYRLRKKIAQSELIKPILEYATFDTNYTKIIKLKKDEKESNNIEAFSPMGHVRLSRRSHRRVQDNKAVG
ncbi:MAG: hypothetical protein IJ776_09695 [Paludibacteraceae bacterium]|nr:hypothetical protein [Paludibacteraceae bacterium]